jgi:hypothetical protein
MHIDDIAVSRDLGEMISDIRILIFDLKKISILVPYTQTIPSDEDELGGGVIKNKKPLILPILTFIFVNLHHQ